MGLRYPDKDPRSVKFEAYCNKHGETPPWSWRSKPVHIKRLLSKLAQAVETIIKMVRFTASIYRIKSGWNTFSNCVQYLTHRQKTTGSRENHYDDRMRRIWLFVFSGEKGRNALALRGKLSGRDRFTTKSALKLWLFMDYRQNQYIKNDSENR